MNYASQLEAIAARDKRNPAEVLEFWLERSAIIQYEAGLSRDDAERAALDETESWSRDRQIAADSTQTTNLVPERVIGI